MPQILKFSSCLLPRENEIAVLRLTTRGEISHLRPLCCKIKA